ncbi:MAG: CapA family protein [Oscillospiraceae bacterium]|nr:CapA family protein [Oscillospiraceae bacterium]
MAKRILAAALLFALLSSCAPPPGSPTPQMTTPSAEDSPVPDVLPSPDPPPAQEPPPSPEQTPSPTPTPAPSPSPSPIATESYDGALYHVFYHFLNAFPEVAFQTSYGDDLDEVCVGPREFWSSLEELHRNDFVLVNLNDYNEVGADGTIVGKPIQVPVGKKPIVISFDDINYYHQNLGKGICDKVILDENGKLAMQTKQPDGSLLVTYDNDVIPLLEAFVEEHPDFSPFGAKGLLSITGFDGILGYRTQAGSPNRESEIEAVKPVVQALLDAGWYFGSHSYSHFHLKSDKVDAEKVKSDIRRWRDEVGPLVGDTRIFIYPYGEWPEHGGEKAEAILAGGFNILCGVGMPPYYKKYERFVFMDRQFIDGNSLRGHRKWLAPLMDAAAVYCPEERNNVPLAASALAGAVDDNGVPVYHSSVIDIAVGGDVAIYGILGEVFSAGGPEALIDEGVAKIFRDADIALMNLESAVSNMGTPWPGKDYTLRADPAILPFLRDTVGADGVSVANNHTIDYGTEAFFDTLDRLAAAGIAAAGGGRDLGQASEPAVFTVNGETVAFLAACQHAPNMEWYAKEDRPGLLMCYDTTLLAAAIRKAKEAYDYVITYIHWGEEYEFLPSEEQIRTAHALADSGADAVLGAHPHVVQSFEVYNGTPIAYSLGNFLMRNPNDNTGFAILRLHNGKVAMQAVPCRVEARNLVSLSDPDQRDSLLQEWRDRSPNALITEDGNVLPLAKSP